MEISAKNLVFRSKLIAAVRPEGGFYCRQTIARSVFVSMKFHFTPPKTPLAQPSQVEGGCSQVATFLKIIDMDINVEKRKRGRVLFSKVCSIKRIRN